MAPKKAAVKAETEVNDTFTLEGGDLPPARTRGFGTAAVQYPFSRMTVAPAAGSKFVVKTAEGDDAVPPVETFATPAEHETATRDAQRKIANRLTGAIRRHQKAQEALPNGGDKAEFAVRTVEGVGVGVWRVK